MESLGSQKMDTLEYLTPRELASKLKMSLKFIVTQTQANRVPGQKQIGRSWRYQKAAIEQALDSGALLIPKDVLNDIQ